MTSYNIIKDKISFNRYYINITTALQQYYINITTALQQYYVNITTDTTRPMRRGEVSGREYVFVLTREEMEEEMERGEFVEVGVYKNHYYGVSYQSIRNISNQVWLQPSIHPSST